MEYLEGLGGTIKEVLAKKATEHSNQLGQQIQSGDFSEARKSLDSIHRTMRLSEDIDQDLARITLSLRAFGITLNPADIHSAVGGRLGLVDIPASKPVDGVTAPSAITFIEHKIPSAPVIIDPAVIQAPPIPAARIEIPIIDGVRQAHLPDNLNRASLMNAGDFSQVEARMLCDLLAISAESQGYLFSDHKDAAGSIYKAEFATVEDKEQREVLAKRVINRIQIYIPLIIKKLSRWRNPDQSNDRPMLAEILVSWIQSQSEYRQLSLDEIELILRRKTRFNDLEKAPTDKPGDDLDRVRGAGLPAAPAVIPEPLRNVHRKYSDPVRKPDVYPQEKVTVIREKQDLPEDQTNLIAELLAIKNDGTDFFHQSRRAAVLHINLEQLSAISDQTVLDREIASLLSRSDSILTRGIDRLRNWQDRKGNAPRFIHTILSWIGQQPEYSRLGFEEMVKVIHRQLTFQLLLHQQLLHQSVTSRSGILVGGAITSEQKDSLVGVDERVDVVREESFLFIAESLLTRQNEFAQLGLRLNHDDREKLRFLKSNLPVAPTNSDDVEKVGAEVKAMIREFYKNPPRFFDKLNKMGASAAAFALFGIFGDIPATNQEQLIKLF